MLKKKKMIDDQESNKISISISNKQKYFQCECYVVVKIKCGRISIGL